MLIDARHIDNISIISGDVCIIGAGAAGIGIALEFIGTPYKVIILEGGGFDYDDRVQELYRGRITGQKYYPLKATRLHYFGGTTGHWGGMCSVFDPITFAKREWVDRSGWPISQEDLTPYYERVQKILGLGSESFGFDNWRRKNTSQALLPMNGEIFTHKLWKLSPDSHRRFGEKYKNDIVDAKNIELYIHANVVNIRATDDVSKITAVDVKNYSGKLHTVHAKQFIMATCAIQTSRLLLASNQQASAGLGNQNDLVGRYFMENAEIHSAELWLNEPSSMKPYMWSSDAPQARVELAMTERVQRENRIVNGMLSFVPLDIDRKISPFINIWTDEDPRENVMKAQKIYGNAREGRVRRLLSQGRHQAFEVILRLEQAPNPISRIALDREKDELGVPRATLNWNFTALEKRSIRSIYTLLGQQVGMSGVGRIRLAEELMDIGDDSMPSSTSGGWHHMGTTRMSKDSRSGVVDENCKVHGIDNLYIAGSSCFPNGGAVNPTFTLLALSLRLSDHVRDKLKQVG